MAGLLFELIGLPLRFVALGSFLCHAQSLRPCLIPALPCETSNCTTKLSRFRPQRSCEDRRDLSWFNTPAYPDVRGNWRAHRGRHVLPAGTGSHAALRAFVAVFRAVGGFFRTRAAVFLPLVAAWTAAGNSSLGCFPARWWPWFSGWMRAASSSIRS